MINIRRETEQDYEVIYNVIKQAFETAEHSGGNEQDLVIDLRKGECYIPELSLVAELEGKIVGHIMFTKLIIGKSEEIALAPLSVLPKYQRKGIGKQLINYGHRIAEEMKYHFSVVIGSENYYPKLGYMPAINYKIEAPFEIESKNFMAIKLNDTKEAISGIVKYAREFGI